MSETPQNNDNKEIDLSLVSKKIGSFFENFSTQIFKSFLFFKRNIIWVGILLLLGAGLGYNLDKKNKIYDNQLIVVPNFGATDYLYAKIDLINSKIEDGDTIFLKEVVGIKNPKKIKGITVTPIVDVYKFVDAKAQNFELFIDNKTQNFEFELIKLMAEDGDIKKVIKEPITSKNYPNHLISFTTVGLTSNEKTVKPILDYLNNSDYYKTIQKETVNNIKLKIIENDAIIGQINGFLNAFNNTVNGTQKSDKLVYYNENSQLNEVIKTKYRLIVEQGNRRLELVNLDKIIKDNSATLNVKNNKTINGKMKLVLPLLLISLFVFGGLLKSYYKTQMAKLK